VLDSFNPYDDVEEHSAGPSSVSYDEDDTYLPPRAGGGVRTSSSEGAKTRKQKKKRSSSSSDGGWWTAIPLIAIGLSIVMTIAAFAVNSVAMPILGVITLGALGLSAAGGIWGLVIAFREGVGHGLLYLFLPFYGLYFTISRWDEMKGPFSFCFTAGLIFAIVPPVFSFGGLTKRPVQAEVAPGGAGNVIAPHVGFQANRPANQNNFIPPPVMQPNQPDGMPNNMPRMQTNNGMPGMPNNRMPGMPSMPPGVPQPPNFGPSGPGGMNNIPGRPGGMNNFPGRPGGMNRPSGPRFGPGRRLGRPGGMPGQ
jgi:hypothetical protein